MPQTFAIQAPMEVLSPRSTNVPPKPRTAMKKTAKDVKPRPEEKPTNPDRIDDKWRPPISVTEPGEFPETYMTGRKLGKGGFAVCFEGKTQSRGEIFALKVVKAEVQQKKMMEKFRTEMQIHAKMRHPNIVEFYRAFSLQGHTYVVLELCNNGSLTDMVKARSCLSLPEVRRYMIQICGGVKYLHKRSVIHRDLKMGNVFLDSKLNLKIGDFGLAAVMADEQDRRTTLCGTPNYIAPEILSKSGTRGHDFKVDTWAIGVICYAMLMGTPPFQSKTQQEIYTKLRTLEYEWKIDSINYIPQEAKDCVASCLNLTAAERPDMDELVEQEFFKTGAIADTLDISCLQSKPTWLQNADPRGDRVKPGYGISHDQVCSDCGVGRIRDGRPRPSVGAKAKISALVEIEIENRQGTAPVTPLPEGILYKQFIEAQTENITIAAVKPRSRKPVEEPVAVLKPTSGLMAPPPPTVLPQRLASTARPTQSFAAQQRQQALPKITSTGRPWHEGVASSRYQPEPEVPEPQAQGLLKAKPMRARSTKITTDTVMHETPVPQATIAESKTEEPREQVVQGLERVNDPRASLRRFRPATVTARSLRSQTTTTTATTTRPLSSSSIPSSDSDKEIIQQKVEPVKQEGPLQPVSVITVKEQELSDHDHKEGSKMRMFTPRLIGPRDQFNELSHMTQSRTMKSLRNLYLSLGVGPSSSTKTTSRLRSMTDTPHPRVDKWVDYATKHGIAYILSEGTLGMILKSSRNDAAASSCVVVRNARKHTIRRARGLEHQFVPQGRGVPEVEFYEQVDLEKEMKQLKVQSKEFELDLQKHSNQVSAATALLSTLSGSAAQRMKEIGLLDKFGKYMNKQMGSSDYSDSESHITNENHFIHFYQRMGNVGCWRFADGAMQFNFPDHTKLVVYQSEAMAFDDEALIDVVYLEPTDARELSAYGNLTNETLERRGLRTFRLSDIRDGTLRRTEAEIIRANEIKEKLSWIQGVIGCWIKEGGLGWTGDEKLGWSGMQERRDDKRIKLQWVTVGRPGGDEEGATR